MLARVATRLATPAFARVQRTPTSQQSMRCLKSTCTATASSLLQEELRAATSEGDKAKIVEVADKIKIVARARLESEKAEFMRWTREYVSMSYVPWFISIAVVLKVLGFEATSPGHELQKLKMEQLKMEQQHELDKIRMNRAHPQNLSVESARTNAEAPHKGGQSAPP